MSKILWSMTVKWILIFKAPFNYKRKKHVIVCMSPVSPVFHTEATVCIGLKNVLRVGTSIILDLKGRWI